MKHHPTLLRTVIVAVGIGAGGAPGLVVATPPAPRGWAVVLEPGAGGDRWALVPIPSMGTPPGAEPPAPPGWIVVGRQGRGTSWVLERAPEQGSPELPCATPAPDAPPAPQTPWTPEVPATPQVPQAPPQPEAPPTPFAGAPSDEAELIDLEQRIVDRVNDARAEAGLPPLQPHPLITEAARGHSEEMAQRDYFAHESPTPGRARFTDRLKLAGVHSFGAGAENIAKGTYDGDPAAGIVQSWLDSPSHRDSMLSERYIYTGVGIASRDGAIWATQVFTSELE